MSNPVNLDNEQRHPIQTMLIRWINVVITSASVIVAIIISFISLNTVNEVKNAITNQQQQGQVQIQSLENEIEAMQQQYQIQSQELLNELTTIQQQYQTQSQELLNELTTIQQQYQIMENILNQEQTVDVIQARENDVLIRTPDDKWIVVPMIEKIDIEFSSEIIEKQYNVGESNLPRVDLFNDSNGDWSDRDAFTYTIPYLSINQNKMVSLNQFINKMTLEYKFFKNDQITFFSDSIVFYDKELEYPYLNVFENINTGKQYVTNELNDGIEDIKISIIIEFEIGGEVFSIPYTFDDWMPVNPDF